MSRALVHAPRCYNGDAYVYLICTERDSAHTKIGISQDPHTRAKSLQTACPYLVYVDRVFGPYDRHTAAKIEAAVHHILSVLRALGEWFHCTPLEAADQVEFVAGLDIDDSDFFGLVSQTEHQFHEFITGRLG